jgi:hypothetical protein
MTPKISCTINTYNEEKRIRRALTHALQWADEVVVVDKGSTDATAEIARSMGARLVVIPFSRQGHEKITELVKIPEHDWIFFFTPGEVPTADLITAMKSAATDQHDLITVPVLFFSFGINHPYSTWTNCFQPRAFHRGRVRVQDVVHSNFDCAPERIFRIPFAQHCFMIHQTHPTAEDFMRSHADYMAAEAFNPAQKLAEAMEMINLNARHFQDHPEIAMHMHAWKVYWHGVALHCLEKLRGQDVPAQYAERAETLLKREWGTPPR